jgi:hypothetical protein
MAAGCANEQRVTEGRVEIEENGHPVALVGALPSNLLHTPKPRN